MSQKYDKIETRHGTFYTTLNKMYRERKPWQPVDEKLIVSFMPGTLVEFNVKAGEKVKEGQQLALFKAMKMNNKILAPMDGKIKALCVAVGETVAKNVTLIEME